MSPGLFLAFAPLALALFAGQGEVVGQAVSRLIVQDEVILRVPLAPRPFAPEIEWNERKGPRCIPAMAIRGAVLSGPGQVDFVVAGMNGRIRAKLDEDCPALDFYAGLYLQPDDERLCADRDAIHSRMGGSCMITTFRHMVPARRR